MYVGEINKFALITGRINSHELVGIDMWGTNGNAIPVREKNTRSYSLTRSKRLFGLRYIRKHQYQQLENIERYSMGLILLGYSENLSESTAVRL